MIKLSFYKLSVGVTSGTISGAAPSGRVSGTVVSMSSPCSNLESTSPKLPFNAILEARINKTSIPANVHVLLSKKSPVFLTPPTTWLPPPPNEEDSPPPFGFCTITTNTSKKQTMIISIKNMENVLILNLYFLIEFSLPFLNGLQRNHFFPDISNLKFCRPESLFCTFFVQDIPVPKSPS